MEEESLIAIEQLKIECIVGVHPREREGPQTILVDLYVAPEASFFEMEDDVRQTIDYRQLAEIVLRIAIEGQFYLLEKMAAKIIQELFSEFKLRWAKVKLIKPNVVAQVERSIVELKCYKGGLR